jgi:hypothetical protein
MAEAQTAPPAPGFYWFRWEVGGPWTVAQIMEPEGLEQRVSFIGSDEDSPLRDFIGYTFGPRISPPEAAEYRCEACAGTGRVDRKMCPKCDGSGVRNG